MGKKIVIMRRINQGDPSLAARKDYNNDFFLPLHYLSKVAKIKGPEWSVKSENNIVCAGCDLIGPKGIFTVRNISRTDKDLVEAISTECEPKSLTVKNIFWKVVEIPDEVEDYVILGTEYMNESVLYTDISIKPESLAVVQKDDSSKNDFGWPQELLESYIPSIGAKLLYNPVKKNVLGTPSCLQSYNLRGEILTTKSLARDTPALISLAKKYYYTKVLELSTNKAKVKSITPAFEIAIPPTWN